ncbi:hypothetical protein Q8F55_008969 [Vanrija albida]|uniref:UBA domain-containing protein n=1 Tax=Vanrija albida TaxID=181172 RepID=A0ABR3PSB8_9TREE
MTESRRPSWWNKLRRGSTPDADPAQVSALVSEGFETDAAAAALKKHGNLDRARDQLVHDRAGHRKPEDNPGCSVCAALVRAAEARQRQEAVEKRRREDEKAREAERTRIEMRNAIDYARYQESRPMSDYMPVHGRRSWGGHGGDFRSEGEFARASNALNGRYAR